MRINVYAEELTDEVQLIVREIASDNPDHRIFYGLRFYLESPTELHHTADDDDRSAITIWVPWTKQHGNNRYLVHSLLENLLLLLERVPDGRTIR
ncbi:MAG: hypothetical protein MN733_43290 [Nitrososphaera sp.]|nr:hypothetical protein [Nitrososphaera sp.]